MKKIARKTATLVRRHKTPITAVAVIAAVLEIVRLFIGCTPEYHNHIDEGAVQVEKGAVQIPECTISTTVSVPADCPAPKPCVCSCARDASADTGAD